MKGAPAFILASFVSAIVRSQAELVASIWDYDVSETFDDVDTDLDLFGPDDEPILASPDQLDQETSGLVSDFDTDLWAEVGDECLLNDGQAMSDIQKRNEICSDPGSPSQPGQGTTVVFPGLVESEMKATQTLTSDDADICRTLHAFDAGYFAVCDSGRHDDRILNRLTGEYTLFHCERSKLRCSFNVSTPSTAVSFRLSRHVKLTNRDSQFNRHHSLY